MGRKSGGIVSNLSWKFAERILAQLVTVAVSVVLARILDPSDYGVIAIVTIFITLANVFVSDGVGSALVQKKNSDALDFTSMLIFNLGLSALLYVLIFLGAPLVADFYGEGYEILVPVLRVLGLRVILTGVNSIQHAYISKHLMFRKYFMATVTGTAVSAVVGIAMAYAGYGVWALVFQYLTNTTVDTLFLVFAIFRFPKLRFSLTRLKGILGFGLKILGTNLLGTAYNQIRAIIIGKVYTSEDLAFFDKAHQFPSIIVNNVNTSIVSVLFPRMALEQDDRGKIKTMAVRSIRFSTFIMAPMMMGLAAVAPNFVTVLLTEKWLTCAPLLQLMCAYFLFWPIHSLNMQVIKALGEGGLYFRLELIKKALDIVILLITFRISVLAMSIGMAVSSILSVAINAYPNGRLIGYRLREQIKDILPSALAAVIMAIAVYMLGEVLPFGAIAKLVLQILAGGIAYLLLCLVMKNKELFFLIGTVKKKLIRWK